MLELKLCAHVALPPQTPGNVSCQCEAQCGFRGGLELALGLGKICMKQT